MIRTRRRLRLCITLLILNLLFIWGNSLLPGSVSAALSQWVNNMLSSLFPSHLPDTPQSHGLLRKMAHLTEFCFLGIWLTWLAGMLKKPRWLPLLCGISAACLDEAIQCFVPDRGPGLRDVALDSSGVILGMILLLAGYAIQIKQKSEEPDL